MISLNDDMSAAANHVSGTSAKKCRASFDPYIILSHALIAAREDEMKRVRKYVATIIRQASRLHSRPSPNVLNLLKTQLAKLEDNTRKSCATLRDILSTHGNQIAGKQFFRRAIVAAMIGSMDELDAAIAAARDFGASAPMCDNKPYERTDDEAIEDHHMLREGFDEALSALRTPSESP